MEHMGDVSRPSPLSAAPGPSTAERREEEGLKKPVSFTGGDRTLSGEETGTNKYIFYYINSFFSVFFQKSN